jgi:hypothetical protein
LPAEDYLAASSSCGFLPLLQTIPDLASRFASGGQPAISAAAAAADASGFLDSLELLPPPPPVVTPAEAVPSAAAKKLSGIQLKLPLPPARPSPEAAKLPEVRAPTNSLACSVPKPCKLLQSHTSCYRALQAVPKPYKLFQSPTSCSKALQALYGKIHMAIGWGGGVYLEPAAPPFRELHPAPARCAACAAAGAGRRFGVKGTGVGQRNRKSLSINVLV